MRVRRHSSFSMCGCIQVCIYENHYNNTTANKFSQYIASTISLTLHGTQQGRGCIPWVISPHASSPILTQYSGGLLKTFFLSFVMNKRITWTYYVFLMLLYVDWLYSFSLYMLLPFSVYMPLLSIKLSKTSFTDIFSFISFTYLLFLPFSCYQFCCISVMVINT